MSEDTPLSEDTGSDPSGFDQIFTQIIMLGSANLNIEVKTRKKNRTKKNKTNKQQKSKKNLMCVFSTK